MKATNRKLRPLRATRPKTLAIRRKTPIPDSTRKEVDRIVESVLASLQHDAVERLCNDDQAAAHIRSLVRRSIRRGFVASPDAGYSRNLTTSASPGRSI